MAIRTFTWGVRESTNGRTRSNIFSVLLHQTSALSRRQTTIAIISRLFIICISSFCDSKLKISASTMNDRKPTVDFIVGKKCVAKGKRTTDKLSSIAAKKLAKKCWYGKNKRFEAATWSASSYTEIRSMGFSFAQTSKGGGSCGVSRKGPRKIWRREVSAKIKLATREEAWFDRRYPETKQRFMVWSKRDGTPRPRERWLLNSAVELMLGVLFAQNGNAASAALDKGRRVAPETLQLSA